MPLTLTWTASTTLPVEGGSLRPDVLTAGASDAARTPIRVGNATAELGDLFRVEGDGSDGALVLAGDLRSVRRIGRGMVSGSLTVRGDVGPGLGQGMHGGRVEVFGSAGDSAGMGIRGGLLHIHGAAGDNLGGSEPGARLGMREGVILTDGPVGRDAGLSMRRGLIAVRGECGDGLGRAMVAGSIFAFGSTGFGTGSGMKRGSIVLFGGGSPRIPPTFSASGRDRPTFLTIYLRRLREWGFGIPEGCLSGAPLARYNGDRAERGQGEILVALGA